MNKRLIRSIPHWITFTLVLHFLTKCVHAQRLILDVIYILTSSMHRTAFVLNTYVFYGHMYISGNNRIIHVAKNFGSGYSSRVFDDDLGHIFTFILDGSYIFADRVRCVVLLYIKVACVYPLSVTTMLVSMYALNYVEK